MENLDKLIRSVERAIRDEMEALTKEVGKCDRFIEKQFDEFIFEWPAEAEGLDATLAAASDFFAKLTRLETDGLPAHEHGVPMYAPVVLDEAFDKADNEFTALAMNIFKNFGFQMIVATHR